MKTLSDFKHLSLHLFKIFLDSVVLREGYSYQSANSPSRLRPRIWMSLTHTTTIGARPGSSWLRSRFCLDKYSPLKNIHTWKIFIPEKYSPLIMHKIGFSTQNMNVFDTSPPPSEPGQGHQWLRSWFCLDRHKYSLFHSIVDFQAKIFFPHTRTPMMVTCSRFFKKSVLLFRAESERLAAERLLEEAKSLIEVQKKSIVLWNF